MIWSAFYVRATVHRVLKSGGVLLATAPGISQIDRYEGGDSWFWAFATHSIRCRLEERFEATASAVEAHGNVLAAIAFLHGPAAAELRQDEFDHREPHCQLGIMARAQKAAAT